jgi:hypothetical protein
LLKNIPIPRITETLKAQFRADFFNIIKGANFTLPNDNRAIADSLGRPVPFAGAIALTNTEFPRLYNAQCLVDETTRFRSDPLNHKELS